MAVLGLAKDRKPIQKLEIEMEIRLGPDLVSGNLTRRELAAKLRERAARRKSSFLGMMYSHWADHIEEVAEHIKDNSELSEKYSLDAPAVVAFNCSYGGEGSCDDCSYSHPGGSCCSCVCDDMYHCEPCG